MRKPTLDFDGVVKLLIQGSGGESLRQLGLGHVKAWLNVDLPRTQHRRVDLLCRTEGGRLVHIELQATNDASMPYRMAEYALTIRRMFKRYPEQVVLYVGNGPLRMKAGFRTGGMVYRYRLVDVRDLDGARLLRSDSIADNTLAMLATLDDSIEGIREVGRRIVKLNEPLRETAIQQLLLTCELRGLEDVAFEVLHDMPITIKPNYRKSPWYAEGWREGLQAGRQKVIQETLRLALKKRFGRVPASVTKRIAAMSDEQAQEMVLATLDAKSLKDLFAAPR